MVRPSLKNCLASDISNFMHAGCLEVNSKMANHLGANQLPITVHEKLNNTVLPKKRMVVHWRSEQP